MLTNTHVAALILALAWTALASAPARANCERSPLGTICGWEEQLLVREWLARQRFEATEAQWLEKELRQLEPPPPLLSPVAIPAELNLGPSRSLREIMRWLDERRWVR
jgi:hypothetical protein